MKILTDSDGKKFKVAEENLVPVKEGSVRATVLKSLRSEDGAKGYIKTLAFKYPNAVITKSLDGYGEVVAPMGASYVPSPEAPVHVVLEEDMFNVVETVSVKNADEMFKMMYKKGLITVEQGMVRLSNKFFTLLDKFTESAFCEIMKSVEPSKEKDDEGRVIADVLSEVYGVLKAMSQEEASNLEGDSRTESVEGKDSGDALGGKVGPNGKTGEPEKQALTEEEASNLEGDSRTECVAPKEEKKDPKPKEDKKEDKKANVFKSLGEVNAFVKRNPDYYVDSPTLAETDAYGKRYKYVAREKAKVPSVGGFGNRRK